MSRNINIPFNHWSISKVEEGVKKATTRRKRYGFPGDRFLVNGRWFVLTDLKRVTLQDVKTKYWEVEGCDSETHFEKVWSQIHPSLGFVPGFKVWLHFFEPEEEDDDDKK